mmetsp:Transcript_106255/g.282728  ORF Transcript_106255/g.282728 Transcript_106255/m.282728 type:complete len:288 (+) Transcript_106255:611-1474(+)
MLSASGGGGVPAPGLSWTESWTGSAAGTPARHITGHAGSASSASATGSRGCSTAGCGEGDAGGVWPTAAAATAEPPALPQGLCLAALELWDGERDGHPPRAECMGVAWSGAAEARWQLPERLALRISVARRGVCGIVSCVERAGVAAPEGTRPRLLGARPDLHWPSSGGSLFARRPRETLRSAVRSVGAQGTVSSGFHGRTPRLVSDGSLRVWLQFARRRHRPRSSQALAGSEKCEALGLNSRGVAKAEAEYTRCLQGLGMSAESEAPSLGAFPLTPQAPPGASPLP